MFILEKRNGYVFFEYPGEFEFNQILAPAKEINRMVMEENTRKVLVYLKNIGHEVNMIDRFNLAVQGAELLRSSVKIACLFNTPTLDRFAENVAVNRGLDVRMFNNIQSALNWLNTENNS